MTVVVARLLLVGSTRKTWFKAHRRGARTAGRVFASDALAGLDLSTCVCSNLGAFGDIQTNLLNQAFLVG